MYEWCKVSWSLSLGCKPCSKNLFIRNKIKSNLIKPTHAKKVKVIFDCPMQEILPKPESVFLNKCGVKKYNFVNTGNRHLVIKTGKVFSFDLDGLSSKLRKRSFFKNINISIYKQTLKGLILRTNEAGAGETLSCGSASAASASFNIKNKSILKLYPLAVS